MYQTKGIDFSTDCISIRHCNQPCYLAVSNKTNWIHINGLIEFMVFAGYGKMGTGKLCKFDTFTG